MESEDTLKKMNGSGQSKDEVCFPSFVLFSENSLMPGVDAMMRVVVRNSQVHYNLSR